MIKNRSDIIRDFNRDTGTSPDLSVLLDLMENVLEDDLYDIREYIIWLEEKYSESNTQ
ncbi:MAG: hypothetical protein PF487_07240 [Bacteroidales bacterium]|jgi:hypothetical protein|nr:hypothetical protein [Bacteroidales bacterium]